MWVFELLLWPGTKACEHFGVDPTSDAGLIRWMVNTLVYVCVALAVVWIIAA